MSEEELRALIRSELDAHDTRHVFEQRKSSTITDPSTGKEWITSTLKKGEIVKFFAWAFSGVATIVLAGLLIFAKIEIYPETDRRTDAKIVAHSTAARIEMQALQPQFASASEVATLRKDLEVSRAQRIEQFEAIQQQLNRIEQRLARMGK